MNKFFKKEKKRKEKKKKKKKKKKNNYDQKRSRSYFNLVSNLHYLSTRFHLQAIKINMTKYNFINQNWKNNVIESFQWRPSKCDTVLKCDDGQVYLRKKGIDER